MENNKRNFIINKLMVSDFVSEVKKEVTLREDEETGKSELLVDLKGAECFCIENVDKKNTELRFFEKSSRLSMFKRVDHILFEQCSDGRWMIHLIEMKSSVGGEKWVEIKGKFRASYLLAQAVAAILEMDVAGAVMYTTYEKVSFTPSETMPSARRGRSGVKQIRMEEEWNGGRFGLNFGSRISFKHIPIQMIRKPLEGLLYGSVGI